MERILTIFLFSFLFFFSLINSLFIYFSFVSSILFKRSHCLSNLVTHFRNHALMWSSCYNVVSLDESRWDNLTLCLRVVCLNLPQRRGVLLIGGNMSWFWIFDGNKTTSNKMKVHVCAFFFWWSSVKIFWKIKFKKTTKDHQINHKTGLLDYINASHAA